MRVDRLWMIGGTLCAVVLLAIGWLVFIGPQYSAATDLRAQSETADDRMAVLQKRLAALREQNTHLAEYQEQLARERRALPTTDALADLLRELQTSGATSGVTVSGITVGTATKVAAGSTQVNSLPINLTAAGQVTKLNVFLDQLQLVQSRAVLISSVSVATAVKTEGKAANVAMSINLQAFYAPTK